LIKIKSQYAAPLIIIYFEINQKTTIKYNLKVKKYLALIILS